MDAVRSINLLEQRFPSDKTIIWRAIIIQLARYKKLSTTAFFARDEYDTILRKIEKDSLVCRRLKKKI